MSLKIGSHISMSGKKMLEQSVLDTVANGANAMMIYTGAPQNTRRKPIEELNLEIGHALLKEHNIALEDVIVHAPYIINLANTVNPSTFEIGVDFLQQEIIRTQAIGAKYIVLHPGAHVGEGVETGLNQIVKGLNLVLNQDQTVVVALETMAGKGTELGKTFEELKFIIENVDLPEKLAVCMDTCHISDAGYDLNDFDGVIKHFDQVVGLDKLAVIHLNDSKNPIGAHKDRHENIGYGHIGFDNLMDVVYHPLLKDTVKILETPYVEIAPKKDVSPYKLEIEMIKNNKFYDFKQEMLDPK